MIWTILAPGAPTHPGAIAYFDDFIHRLQPLADVTPVFLRQRRRARSPAAARAADTAALAAAIPPHATVVLLDVTGKLMNSDDVHAWLVRAADSGVRAIWFVIGGPDGVDDALRARAQLRLSLSPLTLPHDLALVVLVEQLYRAATRRKGLPYHR